MNNAVLQVSNVGKAYRQYNSEISRVLSWFGLATTPVTEKWVLEEISFEVMPGESLGILGHNGAGKSTLLKLITGTQRPTKGTIDLHGRIAAILELGMGFNPEFTGRENASHSARLMGFSNDEIAQIMPAIEDFSEIGDYFDHPVGTYSSGMSMRLAFSVATSVRPEILIIDEALSVGDAYFQAKCFQKISSFKSQGTTLLLVSHSVEDIVKHCDRAILLEKGKLLKDGSSRFVTNIYLDRIFTKSRNFQPISTSLETPKILNFPSRDFLNSTNDKFYTRPGYHREEHRWGQGGASILDYLIISNAVEYPSYVEANAIVDFYLKILFFQDFSSVVPGFLLKSIEGIFLYGTNSFIATQGTQYSVCANQIKIFKFSLPASLNQGDYLISLGISSGDPLSELIPLDRRYDSIILHISRNIQFWGVIDLNASFEVIEG